MFELLFPAWTNPAILVVLVGARAVVNVALTVLVANSRIPTANFAIVAAVLTVLSTVLTVLVLRSDFGLDVSYLEFLVQVTLLGLTGYVVYSNPSPGRVRAVLVASGVAVLLLFVMIPLYGEATVAP